MWLSMEITNLLSQNLDYLSTRNWKITLGYPQFHCEFKATRAVEICLKKLERRQGSRMNCPSAKVGQILANELLFRFVFVSVKPV